MVASKALRLAVALLAVLVVGTAVAPPAGSAVQRETQLRSLDSKVISAINAFRRAHGLVPLRKSAALHASARQHSVEMGADGYFAHSSADGTECSKRIEGFYRSRGYAYWSVGENLLWSTPSISASRALRFWIASPGHVANLLNPHFRSLGVASVHVTDASGVYAGHPVTIITTDFGVRH
jgi:uncharacterized protein YkwD